ncbi:MAG: MarR family transcriptional regulator [Gammaproteobacteria bacterium]|nr:MarR family transcriptional regulator [Gammaproteobacteria bacterium]
MDKEDSDEIDYYDLWNRPGFLIRRLHQIHVAMFLEECREFNVTPVQFAVLTDLRDSETSDLVSIAGRIGVDRVTVADVVRRLERRGLVDRPPNTADKRTKIARITKQGRTFVNAVQPAMIRAQKRFIDPLRENENAILTELLTKLILENDEVSRAPLKPKVGKPNV